MGLFNSRPYKMSALSAAETAAISAACEVVIDAGGDSGLRKAYRHFKKGSLSKDDMTTVIAATAACLQNLKGNDDDLRTTALKKKAVAVVAMAMALDKLMKML